MDETPMPETLDTVAAKLTALGKTIDERFAKVDQQFAKVDQQFARVGQQFATVDQQFAKVGQQFAKVDQQFATVGQQFAKVGQQFAETKAQLGVKIEAVDDRVRLVYDAVIAQQEHTAANTLTHTGFTERLDDHDVRILALEPRKPAGR